MDALSTALTACFNRGMTSTTEWAQVIDAPFEELRGLIHARSLSREAGLYAEALLAYYQSDDGEMARAESSTHDTDVRLLIGLRRQLRGNARDSQLLELALSAISERPWARGEAGFIEGTWRESLGDFKRSKAAFEEAQAHFLAAGAPRKSLRSTLNSLAVSTRLSPRRFLAPRYLMALKEARALREQDLEALCETLLSRAFQRLGCLSLARSHAERALELSAESFGSLQRQRFEAHMALLLIELEQLASAESWVESLKLSEFEEIRIISKLLEAASAGSKELPPDVWNKLGGSWRERWLEFLSKDWSTTDLEGQMIAALAEKPRTLQELQQTLYPDLKNDESSQARTREILRRVRKRWPDLVLRGEAEYSLNQEFELPELTEKAP
jgi:hypothetical protein